MSGQIETRIQALEERIARAQEEARACVDELLVDDGARHLVAERLPSLGSAILPAILELLSDPRTPHEVRALAALAAFDVGDRTQALEVLVDEVAAGTEFAALAVQRLSGAGVSEAAGPMIEAIRGTKLHDIDLVVSYLEALHELGVRLGEEEQNELRQLGSWQVDTALAQWHMRR